MAETPKEPAQAAEASKGIRKGRFEAGMDPLFAAFNSSVSFDKRLYAEDIAGSIAHASMLAAQGIIPAEDAAAIIRGLKDVRGDIESGKLAFSEELEDVHINVETALKEKIGAPAGRLHTARSRNDQVALDLRLYLVNRSRLVFEDLVTLIANIVDKAEGEIDVIMPGYTHLQRAQPVRFSHHFLAYGQMFKRDLERFQGALPRIAVSPLGSAALAGSTFPVDRRMAAQELGLAHVCANSMDAVSDRDFVVEFIFNAALTMTHLSRLAEELIIWSSTEFGFCTLPDAFCSGSSIMPQKKNPDACELVRGKTGRVYGDLMGILTTLKSLPLAYNKDLQEDKEPLFDALDTVRACLGIMGGLVPGIALNHERLAEAAADPSLAATDLADQLTREGTPFREAHERIGAMVRQGGTGEGLPSPEAMVEARNHEGGTARAGVLQQIAALREWLATAMPS